jgi:cytochrome P450
MPVAPSVAAAAPVVDISLDRLESAPLAVWAALRRDAPVAYVPCLRLTLLTRYDDVERVCRDAEHFSAAVPDGPLSRAVGPNFMHADGADHRRVRELLASLLRARPLREAHEGWLRARAADLVADLAARPAADLVADYAHPLAGALLAALTGVRADAATYERWFRGIAAGAGNFEADPAKDAQARLAGAEIDAAITAAEAAPGTLVAAMTAAGFTPVEVSSTVKLFVIGGLQEPRDLLGFSALGLLEGGGWNAELVTNGALPAVIEEAARWGSPVGTVTRTVRHDVRVGDVELVAGTRVAAVLASANHDPARWTDPGRFEPARGEGPHLAYGAGLHTCVGAATARFLVRVAMEELLRGLPDLRLLEPPEVVGYEFRGPRRVLVGARP